MKPLLPSLMISGTEPARHATQGEKLFVLTHTAIDRHSYADAPDCADAMLRLFDIERGFPGLPGRVSTAAGTYASDRSAFHIWGFSGKTWADHIAQHHSMGVRHFSALKAFWSPG